MSNQKARGVEQPTAMQVSMMLGNDLLHQLYSDSKISLTFCKSRKLALRSVKRDNFLFSLQVWSLLLACTCP